MVTTPVTPAPSRKVIWTGRILSALPVLLMVATGLMGILQPGKAQEGFTHYGYPPSTLIPICIAEITCALLYAIPQTAVFGAVLLTGYLGGATATHVRVGEAPIMPIIVGIVAWLGLYLRESRLRPLAPIRRLPE